MTTTAMIEAIKALPEVDNVSIWQGGSRRRAYINLIACDKSFRGNRGYQFYINLDNGQIVNEPGKGTVSSAMSDAVATVMAAINADA